MQDFEDKISYFLFTLKTYNWMLIKKTYLWNKINNMFTNFVNRFTYTVKYCILFYMIKERLKEIDLKITDLSDYLKISRPTLYKFIDLYDSKDYDAINNQVLKLFKYIDNNPMVGKKSATNYILTNLVDEKELGTDTDNSVYMQVKKQLISEPDSSKSKFIQLITTSGDYNDVCDYLLKIYPLLRKRKLADSEIELLKPYDEIRNIMETIKEEK